MLIWATSCLASVIHNNGLKLPWATFLKLSSTLTTLRLRLRASIVWNRVLSLASVCVAEAANPRNGMDTAIHSAAMKARPGLKSLPCKIKVRLRKAGISASDRLTRHGIHPQAISVLVPENAQRLFHGCWTFFEHFLEKGKSMQPYSKCIFN